MYKVIPADVACEVSLTRRETHAMLQVSRRKNNPGTADHSRVNTMMNEMQQGSVDVEVREKRGRAGQSSCKFRRQLNDWQH